MFDVHKMLAVAVYSLLLSIISYKYNNAYYGSVSLIASLEREDTTVPDLPHIVPATVVAIDSENITETEMIIEISQEDSKTSELIGEKDKQKFEEPKEEPGTETETKASEPEEEERRKQEQPEKEPKEEEQPEEEPKEESNDDSLDGVPSELPTEGPKEEPRKDEEKQEQPEKEPKEESNDDSLDGVPSELPTEGPREKTKTETKDSEHEEKEEDQKQQEQPEEEPKEEEEHQEEKSKEEKPEERKPEEQQETTLINVIHKELDKTLYKEAVLITSLVAILVTFMVVIPCDDEEEQQITEIARLKEAIAKLEAEKNKQSADFKQRESEIQADIMETKKLREENERLPAEKKELSKCDVNKQKLVKLKDIAQERKRLLQDERCKLFCVHRAVLGLGVIECVSAYQSEGEFDDTAEDMKDVHTKLMPAHGPEQEFLEKLENVKKMDMEKMTFEDVNSVIEWLPDDYSVTKDKVKEHYAQLNEQISLFLFFYVCVCTDKTHTQSKQGCEQGLRRNGEQCTQRAVGQVLCRWQAVNEWSCGRTEGSRRDMLGTRKYKRH